MEKTVFLKDLILEEKDFEKDVISFSFCRLKNIEGINCFSRVKVLDLSRNSIENIDPLFTCSPTLQVLNLNQNLMSDLPKSEYWVQFQSLQALYLDSNHITSWKELNALSNCHHLITLSVQDNPVSTQSNLRHFLVNQVRSTSLLLSILQPIRSHHYVL